MNLVIIACFTGFVGDFLLQTGAKLGMGGPTNWGLKEYFEQHGPAESLFIAGGMMTLFYSTFMLTGLPINYVNLSMYGILIDLLFRKFMIFKSLGGYYTYFNYLMSAIWIVIPMCIPLFISHLLQN
jgi:hypothetical protein